MDDPGYLHFRKPQGSHLTHLTQGSSERIDAEAGSACNSHGLWWFGGWFFIVLPPWWDYRSVYLYLHDLKLSRSPDPRMGGWTEISLSHEIAEEWCVDSWKHLLKMYCKRREGREGPCGCLFHVVLACEVNQVCHVLFYSLTDLEVLGHRDTISEAFCVGHLISKLWSL